MKLNNKGWDTKEMIILTGIILVFLILASILINNMVDNATGAFKPKNNVDVTDKTNEPKVIEDNNEDYLELETKLKESAARYLHEAYQDPFDYVLYINLDTLVAGEYLDQIYDLKNNSLCEGYVETYFDDSANAIFNPFLKCDNYQTSGYVEER